jgi:hypothetical protein
VDELPTDSSLNWDLLESSFPSPDELRVQEIKNTDIFSIRIFIGLDALRHRHLLMSVGRVETITEDKRSDGVQIIAHPLLEGKTLQPFVDLVCLKPHLQELFSVIVKEVLESLKNDSSRPDLTCRRVLDRWRELLEREEIPANIGLEKIVGLFGELCQLRELVRNEPDSVQYWTGPSGTRHDFSNGSLAIEVKATLSRHGRFFEIHGHEQLEPPESGYLYLVTLKLEQVTSSGESVQDLVESIVSLGGNRYILLTQLGHAGIGPDGLNSTKDIRFKILECRVYEVKEGFPRITSESFVSHTLPAGVVKLAYQIDLSVEPPYPLDEKSVMKLHKAIATGGMLS